MTWGMDMVQSKIVYRDRNVWSVFPFFSFTSWTYYFSVLCGQLLSLKGSSLVSKFVSMYFCIVLHNIDQACMSWHPSNMLDALRNSQKT